EAREGHARFGKLLAEHDQLLALLGRAEPVAGDDARNRRGGIGNMEDERETRAGKVDGVPLAHVHMRSKSWHALAVSWAATSSTGSCLIFATSSATRLTNHGPDFMPSNSPRYAHGPSLSTSSDSIPTLDTSSRSRSRYTTSGPTDTR